MTRFMGTIAGRLDRKGRVSVPAAFRAVLEALGTDEVVLRASHRFECVEAWPRPLFDGLAGGVESLDTFSDAQDDLALALYADAYPLRPDGDGRVVLPEELIAHARLGEAVSFVGAGRTFQIWDPEAARRRVAEAKLRARERALTIPPAHPPAAPGEAA